MTMPIQGAAIQLGALADRAALSVQRLPSALPIRPPARPSAGDAQASIVTHVRGAPGGAVRLVPQAPPRGHYLHLQIGELVFHLHDRPAAHACINALRRVAELGGQLHVADLRQAPTRRSKAPGLDGAEAYRARAELLPDAANHHGTAAEHQVSEPPDATLARAQSALTQAQAALSQLQPVQRASAALNPPTATAPTTDRPAAPKPAPRSTEPAPRLSQQPTGTTSGRARTQ